MGAAYLPEVGWLNLTFMEYRVSTLLHDFNIAPMLALMFLIALSVVGLILHRLVLEPIARLKTGMGKVALGGLNERIDETGMGELTDLTRHFNEMTAQLSATTVSRDLLSTEAAERERAEIGLRQAQEELRESERRFRGFSDSVFEGIIIHDKGIVVDANEMLFKHIGYSREELIGKNVLDLLIPPEFRELAMGKMLSESEDAYEILGRRKDGVLVPTEVRGKMFPFGKKSIPVDSWMIFEI